MTTVEFAQNYTTQPQPTTPKTICQNKPTHTIGRKRKLSEEHIEKIRERMSGSNNMNAKPKAQEKLSILPLRRNNSCKHTPLHRMFTKVNNTHTPPTISHPLSTVPKFCRVDGGVRFAHPTTHGNGLLESQGESVRRKRPIFPHNNTTQVFFPLQFCPCDRWKLRFHRRLGMATAVPTGWELRSQP